MHYRSLILFAFTITIGASAASHFAWDSIGGTLARDHQSRAIYHEGEHRRTYVVYMDHSFFARITYYGHDTKKWVYPAILLDDCIRPDRKMNNAYKDGHNVPNLFITRDGIIHIFYGAHGTVFRYARSRTPENIGANNWELDRRVGAKGTYPFFSEPRPGNLHVFYRHAPEGGYKNPILGLQTTTDGGGTWSDVVKLAKFPEACKIFRGTYDAVSDRVHLLIHPRGPLGGRSGAVHCMYDPESGKLLSLTGAELGPVGTVETFQENMPKIFNGSIEFVLHDGTPYFLYQEPDGVFHFGYWKAGTWVTIPDSEGRFADLDRQPILHSTDGKHFQVYGITDWRTGNGKTNGGDITLWESADGGETWSAGNIIADRKDFGHGFQELNKVLHYAGDGPLFIAAEATGAWPDGWEKTDFTHYDNPSRRDKKLYAFDAEGNVVP